MYIYVYIYIYISTYLFCYIASGSSMSTYSPNQKKGNFWSCRQTGLQATGPTGNRSYRRDTMAFLTNLLDAHLARELRPNSKLSSTAGSDSRGAFFGADRHPQRKIAKHLCNGITRQAGKHHHTKGCENTRNSIRRLIHPFLLPLEPFIDS